VEDNVYENSTIVGCIWSNYYWNGLMCTQHFICFDSLLKFDVSTLSGKTIDKATMRLTVEDPVPVSATRANWHIEALSAPWSPATVTYNNFLEQAYQGSRIDLIPPYAAGETHEIDVTSIVQNWANGTWDNNGLFLGPSSVLFPCAEELDAFGFYSLGDPGQRGPALVVTYH
jgi:hypothetical protein